MESALEMQLLKIVSNGTVGVMIRKTLLEHFLNPGISGLLALASHTYFIFGHLSLYIWKLKFRFRSILASTKAYMGLMSPR